MRGQKVENYNLSKGISLLSSLKKDTTYFMWNILKDMFGIACFLEMSMKKVLPILRSSQERRKILFQRRVLFSRYQMKQEKENPFLENKSKQNIHV
jgi:hypothetical protein